MMVQYQLLPDLSEDEFESLKADIAVRGVMVPVELDETGAVLDGHHRVRACAELGTTDYPRIIRTGMSEDEKREHVLALNLERRHLTHEQRKELVAKLRAEGWSLRRIGEKLGIAHPTVISDLAGGKNLPPDPTSRVIGADGKSYPATHSPVIATTEKQTQAALTLIEKVDLPTETAFTTVGELRSAYKAVVQVQKAEQRAEEVKEIDLDPGLILGDFRTEGAILQDGCADLIFTDPPYNEDAVQLYRDLGVFAARVLRPGGLCLAYSGHAHLPKVMQALSETLEYGWTCAIWHTGGELRFRALHIRNAWKSVLLYVKPPLNLWWDWFSDITSGGKEKDEHEWQQAESEAEHFVKALCPKGGLIIDPFAGSATTLLAAKRLGLRYIGFEVAEDAYNAAQVRLEAEQFEAIIDAAA